MIKMVTKNTWELVIGGEVPKMKKAKYTESLEQKAKRRIKDKARYESERG